MKTVTLTAAALLSVIVLGTADNAHAGPSSTTRWSVVGSGCIIDTGSTSIGVVDAPNLRTTFSGSNTGTIHITCPITGLQATDSTSLHPDRYAFTFIDGDGTTDTCQIDTYLYRYNTGDTAGGVEMRSWSSGGTQTGFTSSRIRITPSTFSHTWDFDNYWYFLYIDLKRTASTCNVEFLGAQLQVPLT